MKDKCESDAKSDHTKEDLTEDTFNGNKQISRATQTEQLHFQKLLKKYTQAKRFAQDPLKKIQKTVGLQVSLDFVFPPSSSENKKRKYESVGNQTENIKDTDDAMRVDSDDYDEFSNNENADSDYEADNDLDCYLCDEDVQPQFRKMEPFQDSSVPHKDPKYIVFHNQLLLLLMCYFCLSTAVTVTSVLTGSMLVAAIKCSKCKSIWEWCRQPKIRGYAIGDILLSGAIIFSGNLPKKSLRLLKSISIACPSARSFFRHQNKHIHHVVAKLWNSQHHQLLQGIGEEDLLIGGDGRCDRMGHSAKYGSYAAVDVQQNKIWQGIKHYFDCWHIAKSIKKKLQLLSKRKGFELVGEWTKSIVNHYYWSFMSTEIDDKDLIEAKWKSLIRHIQNWHEGHGHTFPRCSHQTLSPETMYETVWFTPDSEPCDALENIVLDKTLFMDVANSSAFGQTSPVEGYHSLINQFAPKMYHFSFLGLKTRLLLAAMHFNENAERHQCQKKKEHQSLLLHFQHIKKVAIL